MELKDREANAHVDSITQEVKEVVKFYDRTAQIWTTIR